MAWNGQLPPVKAPRSDVGARRGAATASGGQRQLLPPHSVPSGHPAPGSSRGRLPATYQAAQKAIARCSRIDECKSWSDKAAALASYARQARDHTLRIMAERIQARAVRRCGELLKQVPSGQGSKNQHGELRDGAITRQKAAQDAGLSERQKVTALRLATLPAPKFEALVEADSPPTVTQLAELGTRTRNAQQPRPSRNDSERAARARDIFRRVREFCEQNEPSELASEFKDEDEESLRAFAAALRRWLDEFTKSLAQGTASESSPTGPAGH